MIQSKAASTFLLVYNAVIILAKPEANFGWGKKYNFLLCFPQFLLIIFYFENQCFASFILKIDSGTRNSGDHGMLGLFLVL